ncbi:hypothetical protein HYPSUDRAFT_960307 [Hypholoma sublateritium FD-334 SS-4]|uniref:Uncharacterized protein n=1 Tax=Hypholoma sublateritium (strain FD-334 SS-4) TaxID=945553 RepID=A0A0D2M560_HYPSF|nr:hypothetical protein HYPSUDRAFT_960307 [Hypholoma sublateritium FD-334 SS-4]
MKALSDIKYVHRLSLSDISLTFNPCANRSRICRPLSTSILEFKSVSSDFIAAVFSWASVGAGVDRSVSNIQIIFERCSIPPLEQIPYPPRGIRLTCLRTPSDDSLDNAILPFSPRRIVILGCDGVTDAWIHRLVTNIKYTPRKCLLSYEVKDFENFTSGAILSLVKKHREEVYDLGMTVKVTGQGPVLSEDDARRLRSINECTHSHIFWDVISEKSCII